MIFDDSYPKTVDECLDPKMRFKRATLAAMRRFARSKPWRGDEFDKLCKLTALHWSLCRVYEVNTGLARYEGDGPSFDSSFDSGRDVIELRGRLSVVTYLHEFAHALGKDEPGACRWSINLFRRFFPKSFARLRSVGHTLVKGSNDENC